MSDESMNEPGRAAAEPVSWLRLERYHLGELTPAEAADVERAVAADPATRACLEELRKPLALRPLFEDPSLPRPTALSDVRARSRATRLGRALQKPWLFVLAATVAALVVLLRPESATLSLPPSHVRVKGGDVALELVRERHGSVDTTPTSFAEGDRFKVLLTCPPALDGHFDVVVLQADGASFPLPAPSGVACGNRVPLSGAFSLDGNSRALVCVTWSARADLHAVLSRSGIEVVKNESACVALEAEAAAP
jgi:hypothetical protein